jgi:hypothetical protein
MRLSKTLYVSVQNGGSGHKDDEFLNVTDDPADHAETGEIVTVGRYQLVELGTVTAEPKFVSKRKIRV